MLPLGEGWGEGLFAMGVGMSSVWGEHVRVRAPSKKTLLVSYMRCNNDHMVILVEGDILELEPTDADRRVIHSGIFRGGLQSHH